MPQKRNISYFSILCMTILLGFSALCVAKTISRNDILVWSDFTKAYNKKITLESPKTITVDLPENLLLENSSLFITIQGIKTLQTPTNIYLMINGNTKEKYVLRGKTASKTIPLDTKALKIGINEFHFYCPGNAPEHSSIDVMLFDLADKKSLASYRTPSFTDKDIETGRSKSTNQQTKQAVFLRLPKTSTSNPNAIAVVIGNQNYSHKDIPPVKFANNDASAVRNFLIETMGYKDGNIIYESGTTKAKLEMIFGIKSDHRGMLFNYVKPEKSDVFIYYSGHGAPDPQTNRAYLVPTDGNPVMMSLTGYPLDVLYGNLRKIEAKSVTVVLDACFSGGTDTGKWLVPNASPALIKINNPVTASNNITIFTSAKNNQVSSWYPEKQHSMFTYFFLTAITGSADLNQDKQITYQEIYDFVADRAEGVPYYAKRLYGGRIQNPTMHAANKDAVFVKF